MPHKLDQEYLKAIDSLLPVMAAAQPPEVRSAMTRRVNDENFFGALIETLDCGRCCADRVTRLN